MQQCVHLENDPDREYGINCRSAFLDLDYFDHCSGALVPDVMNDLSFAACVKAFYCVTVLKSRDTSPSPS